MVRSSIHSARSAGPVLFWFGLLLGLIQLFVIWGTRCPLGVPNEWTWARSGMLLSELWNLWPALLTGVPLVLFVRSIGRRCEQASRQELAGWLLVLWLAGIFWNFAVISSIPGIEGLSRTPFVLFYTRSSGYFTQARDEARDLRHFLSTYRKRIDDSNLAENYLHMGTHPPGLTTAFVGLLRVCESSSTVRTMLLASRPVAVRDSFQLIEELSARDPHPLLPSEEAAIWLAAVLVVILSAGTCLPLFLLARRIVSRSAAWWGGAFWLLVPAVMIFFPKSDVLFPCLAMWIQWIWLEGVDRQSLRYGAASGGLMFIAVCLTLAFAPIGLILCLQGVFCSTGAARESGNGMPGATLRGRLRVFAGAGAAFGILLVLSALLGKINLIDVWLQNLRNHAAFYDHATRTYLSWLVENPVELSFSLGLPLAMLAGAGAARLAGWLPGVAEMDPAGNRRFHWRSTLDLMIPLTVWGLLWLSGKNMGEAARLWCFLMPYAVWMATLTFQSLVSSRSRSSWLVGLFVIQMGVCLGTVLKIDGFQFAELLAHQ